MMSLHKLPAHMKPHHPATLIATYLLAGLIKPASGTWGSLAALPLGIYTAMFFGTSGLLVLAAIGYGLGHWASSVWISQGDDKDPSPIVIDEAVGIWLALAAAPLTPLGIALAFVLFRLFDILKPWPVSWADKTLGGATGIMLDDVLAGLWAAILLVAAGIYGIL
jgi:phosphatidylglycerophosphatase A